MSSLKLDSRTMAREDQAETDSWVQIVSPLDGDPIGDTSAVITAITDLRMRYRADTDEYIEIDPADAPRYGGGDRQLADDIAADLAGRWDK